MKRRSKWNREDQQRHAERAAEWLDVLEHGEGDERAEFAEWLIASPRHAQEVLFVTALSEELKKTDLRRLPIVRDAMSESAEQVATLINGNRARGSIRAEARRRWARALAATVVLGLTAGVWWSLHQGPSYTTAIGEQRSLRLEDGSTIQLNTQSRVRVRYSNVQREIRLIDGEALFAVRDDAARPFRVVTEDAVVQALGTQFNVSRHRGGTRVAVVEGKVSVAAPADEIEGKQELIAGEEAQVTEGHPIVKRADRQRVAQAIAWREQQLVFLSDTLADVAMEFNRYNRAPRVVVADQRAGAKRYSGVFKAGDPSSLIQFLREDPGLWLDEREDEIRVGAR